MASQADDAMLNMSPETFTSPPISSLEPVMTTIKLNNGATRLVHRQLLVSSSDNFARALQGSFAESKSNEISLPTVSDKTFAVYQDWLYGRPLPFDVASDSRITYSEGRLIRLYLLAEQYLIPQLKRAAISRYADSLQLTMTSPGAEMIARAFDALPYADPLLGFMVEWCANNGVHEDNAHRWAGDVPQQFLVAVYARTLQLWKTPNKQKLDVCEYHSHKSGEERQRCEMQSIIERSPKKRKL